MREQLLSLGVDLGSASLKIVVVTEDREIIYQRYIMHHGKPFVHLSDELSGLKEKLGQNIRWGAFTGSGGIRLAEAFELPSYSEVTLQAKSIGFVYPSVKTIIELGAQSSKFIKLGQDGSVQDFNVSTNCSAGTGSFLEEQASRLGLSLEELSKLTNQATTIPRIAGRCSVFAKTDIIHHQQEGTSVADIILGLCYALVRTFKGLVVRGKGLELPLLIHGGVCHNVGIIRAIKELFSVDDDKLIVPSNVTYLNALGASLVALEDRRNVEIDTLISSVERYQLKEETPVYLRALNTVKPIATGGLHKLEATEGDTCYLGIDVGSTSTNVVVVDPAGNILDYRYLRTKGEPVEAVRQGILELGDAYGSRKVSGVGVTGSGRYLISDFVGGDLVKDEITAQAKAATHVDPSVDTIIEIGGQDSKFIRLDQGVVIDFEMNKVCAAGTGSFLEEQAKKLGVDIADFAKRALEATHPVSLGERCTVFMDTNVGHQVSRGTAVQDILAGLCFSIANNYLNRVVGGKKIGNRIFFQGGVAHNQGVLSAFQILTKKRLQVPPFFSVTGAWGAALLVREQLQGTGTSNFKGWTVQSDEHTKTPKAKKAQEVITPPLFALREKLFIQDYQEEQKSDVATIGIPRVLFMHKLFPMFQAIFHRLGLNVVISDETNEQIVELSEGKAMEETCYPVKLVAGHVQNLLDKGVDYIFLPNIATMTHPSSKSRQDYPCLFMQSVATITETLFGEELKARNITLIKPTLSFKFGKTYMAKTLLQVGNQLGKGPTEMIPAIKHGFAVKEAFERGMQQAGEEFETKHKPGEKVLVLITRPYGMIDPALNLKIPEQLAKMGVTIVPKDVLPIDDHDISDLHPNMYWPFGQHILSAIRITKEREDYYPVFLTNHGCGPDSALLHYVSEIMEDKPYLHLEVDEHTSPVGIVTRIEAFINSLENYRPKQTISVDLAESSYGKALNYTKIIVPNLGPHWQVAAKTLEAFGHSCILLDQPNMSDVELGRKFTRTKEYFSFVATCGSVLNFLAKNHSKHTNFKLLIPTLEGAEVDGQFGRLIQVALDSMEIKNVELWSPFVEDLFVGKNELTSALFKHLLAVDQLLQFKLETGMPTDPRVTTLFEEYLSQISTHGDLQALMALAHKQFAKYNRSSESRSQIGIVGDPFILYNSFLNGGVVEDIALRNREAKLPWLTEIIAHYFLQKMEESKAQKKVTNYWRYKGFISHLRKLARQVLPGETCQKWLDKELRQIETISKQELPHVFGGFVPYRLAKTLAWQSSGVEGVIHVHSAYENAGLLLSILAEKVIKETNMKWLNLGVDGRNSENDLLRLHTFIEGFDQRKDMLTHVN